MRARWRWALSLVDAALSRVDEVVLPRLSRGLIRLRDRAAGARLRPVTLLVVLLLLAAAALAVATLIRPDPGRSAGSSPVWVGVHDGDSIPAYIELSRSRLAALAAREPDRVVYALLSFGRYLNPGEVAAVVGGPAVSGVTAFARVPLVGRQTERVSLSAIRLPGDLTDDMDQVADRKASDAGRYATLAAEEPPGTLREIYGSNADLSRAESRAYRQHCACVFGLVVRGSAVALVALAGSAEVRAVDPAPELTDPRQAVFAPPLPEQAERAAPLGDDALPSPTPDADPGARPDA